VNTVFIYLLQEAQLPQGFSLMHLSHHTATLGHLVL